MFHVSLLAALLISTAPTPVAESISIHQGIADKVLIVESSSKGGYTGDCMSLSIRSTNGKKYNVIVPPGTHFIANNDEEQDIFVVEEQILALTEKSAQVFGVEGFCSQANDASPDLGSKFGVTQTKDSSLLALARYISKKNIPLDAKNEAIWCVSDGHSVSNIYDDGNQAVKDLRAYVCDLTKTKDVWYNTQNEYRVTETRQIEASPVQITGQVAYRVVKPGKMTLSVFKENGDLVRDIFKDVAMTQAGETAINFKGKVKGWEKGIYFVKVSIDGAVIHSQAFEV